MGYPPTTLPFVGALTLLPWRSAVSIYTAGSIALFLVMLFLLAQKSNFLWSDPRKWYILAFGMALAPLHAGIHECNLSTLVVGLVCLGTIVMRRWPYLSGIALAICLCMKPPLAFLFFAYPWVSKRWKAAFAGLATFAAILAGTTIWMSFHHVNVFASYREALMQFSTGNYYNSVAYPLPDRYLLINIQVMAYQFTHSVLASNLLSWAIFLLLAIPTALLIFFRGSEKNEGSALAMLSLLTLMPVFQHTYSAAMLVFVIYWAIEKWPLKEAQAALLLTSSLLFPLVAMTLRYPPWIRFVEQHHLASNFVWNAFLMPYMVWVVLLLAVLVFADLYRDCARGRCPVSTMPESAISAHS
ncbi:MAG: glycosyltransferase family 87 protein [Formivibrio sp.]|nr:glycosyltransferase family 87 protein [Formivibrio sp.]